MSLERAPGAPPSRRPSGPTAVARQAGRTPARHALDSLEIDGEDGSRDAVAVELRIIFDGLEYIGRLDFTEQRSGRTVTERGSIPGRTPAVVLERARELTAGELAQRYRRAANDKRRFLGLRRATNDILTQIRFLNGVALSMHAGLLSAERGAVEVAQIEQQLHQLVDRLRDAAGVEDGGEG